jgi:hypothetical protein
MFKAGARAVIGFMAHHHPGLLPVSFDHVQIFSRQEGFVKKYAAITIRIAWK